jgi:hypothetical protein
VEDAYYVLDDPTQEIYRITRDNTVNCRVTSNYYPITININSKDYIVTVEKKSGYFNYRNYRNRRIKSGNNKNNNRFQSQIINNRHALVNNNNNRQPRSSNASAMTSKQASTNTNFNKK